MVKIILLVLGFSFHGQAAIEPAVKMNNYALNVEFKFKDANKNLDIKHKLVVDENNKDWMPLAPAKNGVSLIGKIQKTKDGAIKAEYMVIDANTFPVSLHRLSTVSHLGQMAEISSDSNLQQVAVSFLATATAEAPDKTQK